MKTLTPHSLRLKGNAARVMCWLLAALCFVPLSLFAHKPSDSYLRLSVTNSEVRGQWDIAIRDLDFVLGLDGDGDGGVTWGEIKQRFSEIDRHALERLQFKVDGRAASASIAEHLVDNHTDGAYLVLRFSVPCPAPPRFLQVDYGFLFDHDPQHRGLLQLEQQGQKVTAIFSPEQSIHFFELAKPEQASHWIEFVREGVWHIWIGFDHILFLLALLLPAVLEREAGRWQVVESFRKAFINVLKIVTAFTIAHSITLALATLGVVKLPSRLVESVIAASVVLAALHNFFPVLKGRGWMAAFGFGLIHGFGFATVLGDLGLTSGVLALALIGFNVGVELGQLAIVAIFLPLAYALRESWFYRTLTLKAGSALIALVAGLWMVERVFEVKLVNF